MARRNGLCRTRDCSTLYDANAHRRSPDSAPLYLERICGRKLERPGIVMPGGFCSRIASSRCARDFNWRWSEIRRRLGAGRYPGGSCDVTARQGRNTGLCAFWGKIHQVAPQIICFGWDVISSALKQPCGSSDVFVTGLTNRSQMRQMDGSLSSVANNSCCLAGAIQANDETDRGSVSSFCCGDRSCRLWIGVARSLHR